MLAAKNVLQLLQLILAKSNMFENIHETKLLQPITAFDESLNILKRLFISHATTVKVLQVFKLLVAKTFPCLFQM